MKFLTFDDLERKRALEARTQAQLARSRTTSVAGLPTKAITRRPASMSGEGGFSTGIGQGVGFGIGLLIFGTVFTLIKTSRT
jgi:hypothetical protein